MARVERRTKELWVSESCRALLSQDDKRIYASKPHKWEMQPAQFADLQPRTGAPFSISWDERRLDLFETSERALKHDLCLLKNEGVHTVLTSCIFNEQQCSVHEGV
jgi:hypothetical protein